MISIGGCCRPTNSRLCVIFETVISTRKHLPHYLLDCCFKKLEVIFERVG
ncbi:mCG53658 [Mus musculus]|nr:mCG53658 [Mus musculus]